MTASWRCWAVVACLTLAATFSVNTAKIAPSKSFGFDMESNDVMTADQGCLKAAGFQFGTVQLWNSYGGLNYYGTDTLQHTVNVSLDARPVIDGTFVPCVSCGQFRAQVADLAQYLALKNVSQNLGTLWIRVAGPAKIYWTTNQTANADVLSETVSAATGLGLGPVGIYTTSPEWTDVMGSSTAFSKLPLWYSNPDDLPNLDDFVPFGGWQAATRKMFSTAGAKCGLTFNMDIQVNQP